MADTTTGGTGANGTDDRVNAVSATTKTTQKAPPSRPSGSGLRLRGDEPDELIDRVARLEAEVAELRAWQAAREDDGR